DVRLGRVDLHTFTRLDEPIAQLRRRHRHEPMKLLPQLVTFRVVARVHHCAATPLCGLPLGFVRHQVRVGHSLWAPGPAAVGSGPPTHTVVRLQNSRMPCADSSRPYPECLTPPNGNSG